MSHVLGERTRARGPGRRWARWTSRCAHRSGYRTLAAALATEDAPSVEHRRHVARQIARTAEQLERSLIAG